VRVLGIDPGSRLTGWGVVEARGGGFRHLASGTIALAPPADLGGRLARLHAECLRLIAAWEPAAVVLERAFVARNVQSAFRLGEARGALVHVAHGARVRHQGSDGGVERVCHLIEPDAARGEHAAQDLRQAVALADGNSSLGCRTVEAVAPSETARRGHDAEIDLAHRLVRRLEFANRPHPPRPLNLAAILCQASGRETSIRYRAPQLNVEPYSEHAS